MTVNRLALVAVFLCLFAAGCSGEDRVADEGASRVFPDVPTEIDLEDRYLIYLHGAIIENEGVRPTHPEYGAYEYRDILEVFAERGFVVISEARPSGTDGMLYASKVVGQVKALLDAGVPPENLTVVGFSKGGGIAIVASSMLANDDVNFVFIASCNPWLDDHPEIVASGRLLSVRESSDELVGSCEGFFGRSSSPHNHDEIVLELGGGHGAFYRPRKEWVDPVISWAMLQPAAQ